MNWPARIASFAVAAALIAGCGGGGNSTPAPSHATASITPAGTGQTPVGYTSLTLRFTQGLMRAKLATSAAKLPAQPYATTRAAKGLRSKAPTSTTRRPAYLNGAIPNYLDIWVVSSLTQSAVKVVDSIGTGGNVAPAGDGTQTFSIPLYSSDLNQIVAIEYDADPSGTTDLLAIGETDLGQFNPGNAGFGNGGPTPSPIPGNNITTALTMQMWVQYVGVMSDPDNANGDATTWSLGGVFHFQNGFKGSNPVPFYIFLADAEQYFVNAEAAASGTTSGVGGVAVPQVVSWQSDPNTSPANTLAPNPLPSGIIAPFIAGYGVNFNSQTNNDCGLIGGLSVNVSGTNPAAAFLIDAGDRLQQYPGFDVLSSQGVLPASFPTINNLNQILPSPTQIPVTVIDLEPPDEC